MSDNSIKKYEFRLSSPTSINRMYKMSFRGGKRRFYVDPVAAAAKQLLMKEITAYATMNQCPKFEQKIVIAELIPVNFKKGRDINNIHKMLWDAFEEAGIIDNDANIIERPLYREYTDETTCYIKVFLYEAKGVATIEDVENYFFWTNPEILQGMLTRLAKRRMKRQS